MVSASDYSAKLGAGSTGEATSNPPKKRRFKLFATLAAPFKDIDERALHAKRPQSKLRNTSKGNLFFTSVVAPVPVPVKRFPRGGD